MYMKFATMSTVFGSVGSSPASDLATGLFPASAWGANFLSITAIKLNERNYPPLAKSVQVYLLAKGQATYLTDDPPDSKDPSHKAWEKKDA